MIMNVSDQVQLKFHGVSFPAVNFNSHASFLHEDGSKININIDPKVFYPKDKPDYFRIIQEIYLYSEGYFDLNIVAIGTFEIRGKIGRASCREREKKEVEMKKEDKKVNIRVRR